MNEQVRSFTFKALFVIFLKKIKNEDLLSFALINTYKIIHIQKDFN